MRIQPPPVIAHRNSIGVVALILFDVLFASIYLFMYSLTFSRLVSVFNIAATGLSSSVHTGRLLLTTRRLLVAALLLISLQFLVDMTVHYQNWEDPIKLLLIQLTIVLQLPALEKLRADPKKIELAFLASVLLSCLIALLQVRSPDVSVSNVIPPNPILLTETMRFDYLEETGRVTGTYSTAIGLALVCGFAFCICFVRAISSTSHVSRAIYLALIFLLFVVLIFSQTRSAIYGVVPAVVLGYAIAKGLRLQSILIVGFLSIAIGGTFSAIEQIITKYSERSTFSVDGNTYAKITSNVYGVVAALHSNPLFGVPVNRRIDRAGGDIADEILVRKGHAIVGDILDAKEGFRVVPTNHNEPAYFLKYYGVIGFALYIFMCWTLLKKAMSKAEFASRWILCSIVLYQLQYSLLHNTQILGTVLLWVFLATWQEPVPHATRLTSNAAYIDRGASRTRFPNLVR